MKKLGSNWFLDTYGCARVIDYQTGWNLFWERDWCCEAVASFSLISKAKKSWMPVRPLCVQTPDPDGQLAELRDSSPDCTTTLMTCVFLCCTDQQDQIGLERSARWSGNYDIIMYDTYWWQCWQTFCQRASNHSPHSKDVYLKDFTFYTSTFGQSCCLSFLRCKRLTTGKESSLHWFKYKNLYENESFRHWF